MYDAIVLSSSSHNSALLGRSVTIVAAYLMYAKNLDATAALDIIRQVRPSMWFVQATFSLQITKEMLLIFHFRSPNDGFLQQLDVFYQASYKVSRRDKATRMYYLERAVLEILS